MVPVSSSQWYHKGLQSSFVSLAWPWSGRPFPQGEPVGVMGPWTGPNVVRPPVLPPHIYSPTQSLTGWHFCTWLVGWPTAAAWLSHKNVNLTLSKAETFGGQMCYYFGQVDLWSDVPPSPGQRHLVAKCDTTSPLGQVDLQSDVSPTGQRHLLANCDTTPPLGLVYLWPDAPPHVWDILWPSLIILQVRLTCLFEGKSGANNPHTFQLH